MSMISQNHLKIQNLDWNYGSQRVLNNLNFNIEKGKFYTILGPNGSGKTTLAKIITKSLEIDSDKIFLISEDLSKMNNKQTAKRIATVPQNTIVDFDFSVMDIVLMGRAPYLRRFQSETSYDLEIAKNAMKKTNTWHLKDKKIDEISGGERQRVIIARAITQDTEILILDEPISNIDIHHQIQLLDVLKNLNKEKNITIITILHDLNLAAQYSDEIILLSEGEIVTIGNPQEVLTKEVIKEVIPFSSKIKYFFIGFFCCLIFIFIIWIVLKIKGIKFKFIKL